MREFAPPRQLNRYALTSHEPNKNPWRVHHRRGSSFRRRFMCCFQSSKTYDWLFYVDPRIGLFFLETHVERCGANHSRR